MTHATRQYDHLSRDELIAALNDRDERLFELDRKHQRDTSRVRRQWLRAEMWKVRALHGWPPRRRHQVFDQEKEGAQ